MSADTHGLLPEDYHPQAPQNLAGDAACDPYLPTPHAAAAGLTSRARLPKGLEEAEAFWELGRPPAPALTGTVNLPSADQGPGGSVRSKATPAPAGQPYVFPSFVTRPNSREGSVKSAAVVWNRRYVKILLVTDALVVLGAVLAGNLARFGLQPARLQVGPFFTPYLLLSLVISLAWMLALHVYGSRDARIVGMGTEEYKRTVNATFAVMAGLAFATVVLQLEVARGYFAFVLPIGTAGLISARWLLRQWLRRQRNAGRYLARVLVLGRPRDVRYVVHQISSKSSSAYKVVGVALTGKPRTSLDVDGTHLPVVSDEHSVVEAASRVGADAVIVAGPTKGGSRYVQELGWQLEESATQLILTTGLTNVAGPRIHSRPVEGLPLMHVELPHYAGGKHVVKRALDITLSGAALLVLIPVFAVLAILVRRDSPGPVIFRQERVGRGGGVFEMLKFRSMVQSAEEQLGDLLERNEGSGLLFKMQNDPRVTRVGQWMRKYSLDELPQLWNVFVGHMSLVGPRPPLPREVAQYGNRVHRRLYIKPGLTGMWQINGRSELNWKDGVRLDLYYVENWSLAGDLIILWRTVQMLRRPVGAY